jgi:hypothetical protein
MSSFFSIFGICQCSGAPILQDLSENKSREKGKLRYIVKFASLAICETCNLRDSQTSKIIIHSEKLAIFAHNSALWPIARKEFDSHVSHYEISVCETRKKRVLLEICL